MTSRHGYLKSMANCEEHDVLNSTATVRSCVTNTRHYENKVQSEVYAEYSASTKRPKCGCKIFQNGGMTWCALK